MLRTLICSLLLLSTWLNALSKEGTYNLRSYNVKDGLSQNSVIRITQDRRGFIWIATRDGLNRFDGAEFDIFRADGTKKSLTSSDITSMIENKDGRLWVATHKGLNLLDPEKGVLQHFHHSETDTTTLSDNCIKHLFRDKDDRIWVGTIHGLDLYDAANGKFRRIVRNATITWIIQDSRGNICYATDKGLYKMNPDTFVSEREQIGHNLNIYCIFEDPQRRLWIGTWNDGLWYLDKGLAVRANLKSANGENFNAEQIGYIVQTPQGELMLASRKGVLIYDKKQERVISQIKNDGTGKLNDNAIIALYQDAKQNVWIGTWSGGVSIYNPYSNNFEVHNPRRSINQPVGNVNAMVEHKDNVWIATDDGLIRYDIESKEHRFIPLDIEQKQVGSMREVRYIQRESDNLMWVSVYANGLHLFDMNSQKIVKTIEGFRYGFARRIEPQGDGNYWIATNTNDPLIRYNPKTGRFQESFPIKGSKKSFAPVNVQDILVDGEQLWVGTRSDGLYCYNTSTTELKQYIPLTSASIPCEHISTIFRSTQDELWIGTFGQGVGLYNPEQDNFTMFAGNEGIDNGAICGIIDGDKNSLWVSTLNGVSRLDRQLGRFENWGYKNGYPLLETTLHATLATADGELIVGGKDMFTSYRPDALKKNPYIPDVYITKYNIWSDNSEQGAGPSWHDTNAEKIVLKHNQTSFSLKFAALNYVFPENNSYAYMLEGFDKDWVYCANTNVVSYTNIPSGSYRFRVKASNNDGLWNETGDILHIVVKPPLWLTWWAFALYAACALAIITLFVRHWLRETKLETDLRIKQAEKATLEQTHQMQVRMFTNFSHELRTPLTLIMGPLNELLQRSELSARAKEMLDMINRNAHRLLWLANQLMDLRKLESGKMQLVAGNEDFDQFLSDVVLSFNEYAKSKDIKLTSVNTHKGSELWYDPILTEKVLFNLLSNAFKHTPKGGEIAVHVGDITTKEVFALSRPYSRGRYNNGAVLIKVCDTGKGIAEDMLDKLFNPFFQATTGDYANVYGTGIGLNLCKAIVELHGGDIWAESTLGHGSTINILLPLGKEYLPEGALISHETPMQSSANDTEMNLSESAAPQGESAFDVIEKHRLRILIVEDNPEVLNYLNSLLRNEYQILTAMDCMQGCEIAQKELPDLILSDVMTPKMNGIEMCEKLKGEELTNHIPIVLLTARTASIHIREGYESLADDYILKPFDPDLLKIRLRNILLNRERLRENLMKNFSAIGLVKDSVSTEDKFIKKIFEYVKKNIDDPDLSIDKLSNDMAISRVQLYRKIKAVTGVAPSKLILDMRLRMAAELLTDTNMAVSEIAYKCGFNEVSYFGKRFKALFGTSPSTYGKR